MTPRVRHQGFIGTVVQSAPRLRTLLVNMRPTWHLSSLAAIDRPFLDKHAVTGLIWDVDGTLTPNRGAIAPDILEAFESLIALDGVGHVILSNADEARFRELGEMFPTVVVIRGYSRLDTAIFCRLTHRVEEWSHDIGVDAVGAVALRKPSAELVREAIRVLGCDPIGVVMIGDQYLTDIAGANLAGIRSIKVPTLDRASFPIAVRAAQQLEAILHRIMHGRRE